MGKVNPFLPTQPVHPEMFVGRQREIERIEHALVQSLNGRPSNILITGERGIGKTSLLLYARAVATGLIQAGDAGTLDFVVLDTDIDASTSQIGLMRKIELALRHDIDSRREDRSRFTALWEIAQRIETVGPVTLREKSSAPAPADEALLDEFAYSLAETVGELTSATSSSSGARDGLMILVDEADKSSPNLDLGVFLKLLAERLQRRGCDRVCFVFAGLPNLPGLLEESHPSSLRLFEELDLGRLSGDQTGLVIDGALARAKRENERSFSISEKGRSMLVSLSEGYPHFIQQFGYSAFDYDSDDLIDHHDVIEAAFNEGGALELIGDRYYRSDFYQRIQKDSYRQVLRIMARLRLEGWVEKSEIRKEFKGKDSTLDNAIRALRDRGFVVSKTGVRGVYRLRHQAFALWIRVVDERQT